MKNRKTPTPPAPQKSTVQYKKRTLDTLLRPSRKFLRQLILREILKANVDCELEFAALCDAVKMYAKTTAENSNNLIEVSNRKIYEDCSEFERDGSMPGYRLHVTADTRRPPAVTSAPGVGAPPSGTGSAAANGFGPNAVQGHVVLSLIDGSTIEERARTQAKHKRALGEALWHYLFGLRLNADQTVPDYKVHGMGSRRIKINIESRRGVVQRKNARIAMDAGSTMKYMFETLLRAPTMPCRRREPESGDVIERSAEIAPEFVTNSPLIASSLRHSSHSRAIKLCIIGGMLRTDRASICGALSEKFLKAAETKTDCTIIGITDVQCEAGLWSFNCDNDKERTVKQKLLAASRGLRIICFTGSKLAALKGRAHVVGLNRNEVDMLVVDIGTAKGAGQTGELKRLIADATGLGIAVLVVGTPEPSKDSTDD